MPQIELTPAERREQRAQAHHLDPVVMVGGDGITPNVRKEIDAALNAHGLIKVRIFNDDRAARELMYQELAAVAEDSVAKTLARGHNRIMVLDIVLKLLGLVLTLTVFPSAMMWSVLITALVLIIPRSL